MNKVILFSFFVIFSFTTLLFAEVPTKVVVTYPYIESIVKEIGGDKVDISVLAKGTEDPHFVVPKPSLIGKIRQADLMIINGASLEIGFVPPLLRQANNAKINPGSEYLIDLSKGVELIQKPEKVSRSEGDIHPEGNPHYYLSYNNLPRIAAVIRDALIKVRSKDKAFFEQNYDKFIKRYEEKKKVWDEKLNKIKGCKFIQYHRNYDYIIKDANCTVFAEIEPKPGIPPTAKHIEEIIDKSKEVKVCKIITDVYHETKSTKRLSSETNIPYVIVPHDVRSIGEIRDIFSLYDFIVSRISE